MHCASLGEFEQGRSLIEDLKQYPELYVVLTFFTFGLRNTQKLCPCQRSTLFTTRHQAT
ncbi:MAG: hypothetical protein IPN94_24890 [Sphingobacteriales bacterium]|nr:hypothetical protein [Sphingobacteriales bacterium]